MCVCIMSGEGGKWVGKQGGWQWGGIDGSSVAMGWKRRSVRSLTMGGKWMSCNEIKREREKGRREINNESKIVDRN